MTNPDGYLDDHDARVSDGQYSEGQEMARRHELEHSSFSQRCEDARNAALISASDLKAGINPEQAAEVRGQRQPMPEQVAAGHESPARSLQPSRSASGTESIHEPRP